MRKIPSVFERAWDGDRQAMRAVTAGTEWVLAGEGVATRKWDGTCCLVRGGKLFKRYEVKAHGRPPQSFEPATEADPITGKQQGVAAGGRWPGGPVPSRCLGEEPESAGWHVRAG